MKKTALLFLVMVLIFSFAGCARSEMTNDITRTEVKIEESKPEESKQDNKETVQELPDDNDDSLPPIVIETPAPDTSTNANITESVIFDGNDIKVTAKSIAYDGSMGPEIALLIENNSAQNITVAARNASINGFMIDPMLSAKVAAGKKK